MDSSQKKYLEEHGNNLLEDYIDLEFKKQERLVYVNKDWVALVPWWAEAFSNNGTTKIFSAATFYFRSQAKTFSGLSF